MKDQINRPLNIQEYEDYKQLRAMVESRAMMSPDQKAKYNRYEARLWWHPTEEEEAYYEGLAKKYYNKHFLLPGEEPFALDSDEGFGVTMERSTATTKIPKVK